MEYFLTNTTVYFIIGFFIVIASIQYGLYKRRKRALLNNAIMEIEIETEKVLSICSDKSHIDLILAHKEQTIEELIRRYS